MLNQYQQEMFDRAELLVATGDAFYRQEFELDGHIYWIYNYRLASYTEFERPGGREMRGHMFEMKKEPYIVCDTRQTISENGEVGMNNGYVYTPIRLAALPMQKFHNLNENPMTMDLDLSKVDTVELKADGSLISTYVHNDELRFKSKGSLGSEQAVAAMKWIDTQPAFKQALAGLDNLGWTVNLEWCAPDNRIVIGYERAHLKVLNVRNRNDGSYMARGDVEKLLGVENVIDRVDTNGLDTVAFVQSIPAMLDDIEGYVARIGDLWFKIKTNKYMSLHHTKDSINNPRRLYEAVLDEGIDDLRALFFEDKLAIKQIDEMQEKVDKLYNHLVASVEGFYNANQHLDRKEFAIKGQVELPRLHFGLAMNLYLQKDPDFKGFMKSKYKLFGIIDSSVVE